MALKNTNKDIVLISKSAKKELSNIPSTYYRLITDHLLNLENNPFPHGSIKLMGHENGYRLRVGQYRILYTVEHNKLTITVIKIGHRKDVYN